LVLEADRATPTEQPIVLSEFGGIAFARDHESTWGYSRVESAEAFAGRYVRLMSTIHSLNILAGFCYTQFADTYQEANGLLYEDRTPKFPVDQIARATRGQPIHAAGPEPQAHNIAAMKASATDAVAPGPAPVPVTIGERPE
jgi:hypothetical protein